MSVNTSSHVPIYEQIADHVRQQVAAGVFRADEPLPSIRALALEMVVNPNTVQRAYMELEREGLVSKRKGLGVFVTGNGVSAARRHAQSSVQARFAEGIEVGRTAGMSDDRLAETFQSSLRTPTDKPSSSSDTNLAQESNP